MQYLILGLLLFLGKPSFASTKEQKKELVEEVKQDTSTAKAPEEKLENKSFKDRLGMGYFFFFDGPNLENGRDLVTNRTGITGNPINSYYIFSLKYKLTEKYSLDFQPGMQHWYTRVHRARFDRLRVGISGKIWQYGYWTLDGAANSDVPYTGYTAEERTLIFSPGLFAGLSYRPSNSRWSMYTLVMPRVWFYADKDAVEPEWLAAGRDPGEKFQSIMQFTPTVNYAITDKFGLRAGLGIDYRKFVKDEWTTWRRWDTPVSAGFTYSFTKALNIYTFVQSFPLDGNRPGLNRVPHNGFRRDTSSIGTWISGTIF